MARRRATKKQISDFEEANSPEVLPIRASCTLLRLASRYNVQHPDTPLNREDLDCLFSMVNLDLPAESNTSVVLSASSEG